MSSLKVLACGDVCGRLTAWLKRLNTVCNKAGPFNLALCVGSFYSPSGEYSEEDQRLLDSIKSGKTTLPLPVYILGPNSQCEVSHYGDLGGYEIAENLIYLGSHGCYLTKEGLKIAYLSGVQDGEAQSGFNYGRIKEMQVQLKWDEYNYDGVDILLTSQWPAGKPNKVCKFHLVYNNLIS